jgi:glycosyltransferase involved in cell wall biosynthesis
LKLLFLTDNFPPEVNAPATRTFEHCVEWVKSGIDVTVITCFPNFPEGKLFEGYHNRLCQVENIDGIRVVRVITFITANEGLFKRTLDYISFGIVAFIAGLFIKTDLIIATSPQFFAAISARWLGFFKRKSWVMEVRDLWPESIKTVGAMKDNFVIRYFERLEVRLYRSALHIITVTDTFKSRIISRGIDPGKISVIKNGANHALFIPRQKSEAVLSELGLKNKFILGFIGTIGMAHKLDFIVETADRISDPAIHFLIVGAGAEKNNLKDLIEKRKPGNVTLIGLIPKERVPEYLSVIDVSLINLKKSETFKTVIPSKIFESSAMEKPILLGVDGEARQLVESYSAGLFFEPENGTDMLEKILLLRDNHELYERLRTGCSRLAIDYDRVKLAAQMGELLQRLNKKENI